MMLAQTARKAKRSIFARYQTDPVAYAADVLQTRWWSKQVDIAESIRDNRRTVVYAGHAVGKTHGIGGLVQWHFDCFSPSITLTTAPSWESIHDLLWGEIKAQRPAGLPGRLLDLRLDSGPIHYAKGHNADKGAGFQGRHEARQLLVLDEAMGIPLYIYEAANSMMVAPDCRMVLLGNPTESSGPYYDAREDPEYNIIHISCLEHPNIAAELDGQPPPFPKAVSLVWVQEMIERHTEPAASPTADSFEWPPASGQWRDPDDVFRSRVLGMFPRQSSQAIWSDAWLERARSARLSWDDRDGPEVGIDVARFGDDETVMYARRGPVVTHRESYHKQDTMETAGRAGLLITAIAAEHNTAREDVIVKVDDVGVGGGVTDRLREMGFTVYPINAGARAADAAVYFNMRSELWFAAAEAGRNMKLDLSHLPDAAYRKLAAELRATRYKLQSDKTLRVEGKADFKARVGRSPDDADAFNLCFYPAMMAGSGVIAAASPKAHSKFTRDTTLSGGRWRRGQR